ncbi:MAG: DUF1460 domain-containing protein [Bacteroidia bacterium]|nr:DUF1460 domain-containing protein [Bacteroidia bacterium]
MDLHLSPVLAGGLIMFSLLSCQAPPATAQQPPAASRQPYVGSPADSAAVRVSLEALMATPRPAHAGSAVVMAGTRMMGTPYVGGTLEVTPEETLVVNLRELDCTTFLENAVVMARLAQQQESSFQAYLRELTWVRYRGGEIAGYTSRLHYFTDWIGENTRKGIIRDITASIGGEPYLKKLDFMSTHTTSYRQLADPALVREIIRTEDTLNTQRRFFIPKARIHAIEHQIQDGDLLAITTTVDGLDVSHVGIAIHQAGRLHMLHASSVSKQVEITQVPLADYLAAHKSQSGIIVCRLMEP